MQGGNVTDNEKDEYLWSLTSGLADIHVNLDEIYPLIGLEKYTGARDNPKSVFPRLQATLDRFIQMQQELNKQSIENEKKVQDKEAELNKAGTVLKEMAKKYKQAKQNFEAVSKENQELKRTNK